MASIYKRDRGFELWTTKNKSSKCPERDSNPGPPDCESDPLTTRSRSSSFFELICNCYCNLQLLFQLERLGFQLNVNLMRNRTDCYSKLARERMPKNRVYLRACIHAAYFINLFQPRWFYLISTFLYPRCGPMWLVTWSRNTFAFVAYTY